MASQISISSGQYSNEGRKQINQDFHGILIPNEPQLSTKGIAIALADGISSSKVSQVASEAAVTGFLEDYYCTSEAWSVKKSAQRVLVATNSWLHAQTRHSPYRYDKDRGYVCTFSAVVLKSNTAHLFHVGDTRIYLLRDSELEQLTEDHRLQISQEQHFLSRALGIDLHLEIDYRALQVEEGDSFVLMTDGVYEFTNSHFIIDIISSSHDDLDAAACAIANDAYHHGSNDNLTIQIVKVESLPSQTADEYYRQLTERPFPPILQARMNFDGYRIIRELHASSRSHIYLAIDVETQTQVVIKTPSIDLRKDPAYLERFLMEDWIARRINSPNVLKPCTLTRKRHYLYAVTEFIQGRTLAQWMIDHPKSDLETVRGIVEQIARGLRAFHRLEMLHQDLRPDNVLIDNTGTVKIIDFGSTQVAGLMEMKSPIEQSHFLGTVQYAAPEYFLGECGTTRSDLFSLAVITYQMLSGRLPYGMQIAKCRTRAAQNRLNYRSVRDDERELPVWIDSALKKALEPNPYKRYGDLFEFIYDLRHPNQAFLNKTRPPLVERNPVIFWKGLSLFLALIILALMIRLE